MSEKVTLPLSLLRPIQKPCLNNGEKVKEYWQQQPTQYSPLAVVWIAEKGFFAILDGHHRFVAAWQRGYPELVCEVVELSIYAGVTNMRGLLVNAERLVEEYESEYCLFMTVTTLPAKLRVLVYPSLLKYLKEKEVYEAL